MNESEFPAIPVDTTLSGAARLRLLIRHWTSDSERRKNGREIIYAVDTSAVLLFLAADRNQPQIFFLKDGPKLSAFTSALSYFIFYSLQDKPLLVIPPHDVELIEVMSAIAATAKGNADSELPNALAALAQPSESPEVVVKALLAQAPTVISALFNIGSQGPMRELERYRALLREQRIQNLHRRDDFPQPGRVDWQNIDSREVDFYAALKQAKGVASRAKDARIMRDARAMAYVEWLNKQIGPERVVHLVAFDDAMASVADMEAKSDAEHFVRDPRYFLEFNRAAEVGHVADIAGLIDEVLLGLCPVDVSYLDWLQKQSTSARDTRESADPRVRHSLRELSDGLSSYAEETSLRYGLLDSKVSGGFPNSEVTHHVLDYLRENQERLEQILKSKIAETINDVDRLAFMAGFFLFADRDQEFGEVLRELVDKEMTLSRAARAPAWFRFQDIGEWAQKLHDELVSASGNVRKVTSAFAWPGSDIRKQYELRIVHAYAMSLRGHWDAAQNLCRRAKAIADGHRPKIFGHEAAYFRAVCLRHLARTSAGVEEAKLELLNAEQRWDLAHADHPILDPRFAVERLVQRFTEWELEGAQVLAGATQASNDQHEGLRQILTEMGALWPAVWAEDNKGIRDSLALQLFINIAEGTAIEHLVLFSKPTFSVRDVGERLHDLRAKQIVSNDNMPLFVQVIVRLTEWLVAGDEVVRRTFAAKDARDAIRNYLPHSLEGYEVGLLHSFQDALERSLR